MSLSAAEILAADDLVREQVSVPEWGGSVCIRTLTGTERDKFEASVYASGKASFEDLRAKLLVLCLVDANGARLFGGDGDVKGLGAKSSCVLDRLFAVAQRLNGLSKRDLEDLEKNSSSGPGAASG